MTNTPDDQKLVQIAGEAQAELEAAERTTGIEAAEFGYYQAELESLRDAATSLHDAEQLAD